MRTTAIAAHILPVLLACLVAPCAPARAGDYWKAAGDAGVVTNNDCGFVSAVVGTPTIKRSFMSANEDGLPAYVADRINSGDTLAVPPGGRVEVTCGKNTILVLGPGSRMRLSGLRGISGQGNAPASRLDVVLEAGELRAQVRLNDERPEAVLAGVNGVDVLVTRGDVEVFSDAAWRAACLNGSAFARVRRGTVAGAPFEFAAGSSVSSNGQDKLDSGAANAIRGRLPFSFESLQAALPPRPGLGSNLEAP